jgi:hypothetical protein
MNAQVVVDLLNEMGQTGERAAVGVVFRSSHDYHVVGGRVSEFVKAFVRADGLVESTSKYGRDVFDPEQVICVYTLRKDPGQQGQYL